MSVLTAILIQILFTGIAAYGIFMYKKNRSKKRDGVLEVVAKKLGLRELDFGAESILSQLAHFKLFKREERKFFSTGKISRVFREEVDGAQLYLFEYRYTVSQGKSSREVHQLVFFADDRQWYLPHFRLAPETYWDKFLAILGKKDINFEDDTEFSEKFWLETNQLEEHTRKFFRPELRALLKKIPPIEMEGSNYYFMAHREESLSYEEGLRFFADCKRIFSMLKSKDTHEIFQLSDLVPTKEFVKAINQENK